MIIEYLFTVAVFYIGFFVGISPVICLMSYLGQLPDSSPFRCLATPIAFLVLVLYLVVVPFLAHQAAKLRVYKSLTYRQSLSGAFAHGRIILTFIPFAGWMFMPKDIKKDDNDDDAAQSGRRMG